MGDSWLIAFLSSRWVLAALAFALGAAARHYAWPKIKQRLAARAASNNPAAPQADESVEAAPNMAADNTEGDKARAEKITALEAELQKAKSMLEAQAEDEGDMMTAIAELDDAVKRANGRLKLMVKSLERED